MSVAYLAIKGFTSTLDKTLNSKGFYTILVQDTEFNIIDSFVVLSTDLNAIDYYNEDIDTITMYNRLCKVSQ